MSCNGSCYMVTMTHAPLGASPARATYGQKPIGSYRSPSYWSDPNAKTALEFEQAKIPIYVDRKTRKVDYLMPELQSRLAYLQEGLHGYRNRQKGGYQSIIPSEHPDAPQEPSISQRISRFEANVLYATMMMAGGPMADYSFGSALRQAWENARSVQQGKFTIIDAIPGGHLRAYTLLNLSEERTQGNPLVENGEIQRTFLRVPPAVRDAGQEGSPSTRTSLPEDSTEHYSLSPPYLSRAEPTNTAAEEKRSLLEELIRREQALLN